jgi:DNA-binding NtrC family response regulator
MTLHKKNQQYHQLIGESPPMQDIYQTIAQVAKSNATVLIMGETGTGKELCAEAIHQESLRRKKPFVVFNCATNSSNLMDSELFGHVKGAFTGADKARKGAALSANGGTLFLDEIGEMDYELQKKLLRFVETKSFNQVGSNQLETVNIRFIFATNRHLPTEMRAGRFRDDLYYRLTTIIIQLPPLRDRGDDVLLLAQKFLDKCSNKKKFQGFSLMAEKFLLHYKWPGNVRQLKSCIQSLVLFNEAEKVTSEMLIAAISNDTSCSADMITSLPQSTEPAQKLTKQTPTVAILNSNNTIRTFEEIKKDVILTAIEYCNGNVKKAAKELGIGYATIYHNLQKWKISLRRKKKSVW